MKINEVIVVEGEHDATKLKQLFDVEIIVTNGSAINQDTLNLIKQVNETRGVIVFCDPDYPGEQIRKKIIEVIPKAKHAYLNKSDAIDENKHKVGVEHASDEKIIAAINNVVSYSNETTLSYEDYLKLNLVGNRKKRESLCQQLNIGICNAKTLYKRLNMLSLTYDEIKKKIGDKNE